MLRFLSTLFRVQEEPKVTYTQVRAELERERKRFLACARLIEESIKKLEEDQNERSELTGDRVTELYRSEGNSYHIEWIVNHRPADESLEVPSLT